MRFSKKDLDTLISLGAAVELVNENKDDYDFWYNIIARVYNSDGSLYAKVLVVSHDDKYVDLRGRLFIARGSMAYYY